MKVVRINPFSQTDLPASVCALGYFDGIHKGHRQLIEAAISNAKQRGVQSAVLSFDPDPWQILKPESDLHHLSDLSDKISIIDALGVDLFYIVSFSKEFAAWSNERFHQFLRDLHIVEIVCGFDYTYGKKGSGNTQTLRQASGFDVDVIDAIEEGQAKISSSRIEALIEKGDVREAGELLGFFYSIRGVIESGFQRGRLLGYPTANLAYVKEAVLPKNGVYAGYVQLGNEFFMAMINIGKNPTFNNTETTIEAYILDFDRTIYGMEARFYFCTRLRGEIRFSSLEDLKDQLKKDTQATPPALEEVQDLLAPTIALWTKSNLLA